MGLRLLPPLAPFVQSHMTTTPADPLEVYRLGLALFRRAGLSWFEAYYPAREAALSVEPDPAERDEWACVLSDTRTAWMRAYERRPTGCSL